MDENFASWTVARLKAYLQDCGVTVAGYRKDLLCELATAVNRCKLPIDPDFSSVSTAATITDKLTAVGISDDPWILTGFSKDLNDIPDFGLYDIINYLLFSRADYDRRKLRAYKSFDDYRLFCDGHVESLKFNSCADSEFCIFRCLVRPTQRTKTYLKSDTYRAWFVIEKENAEVRLAFCQCPGGSDGACRHVAACLYELEAWHSKCKSVTEGPVQWCKRPRPDDEPEPAQQLRIKVARYADTESGLHSQDAVPDLRQPVDQCPPTTEAIAEFAAKLRKIDSSACCLELLEEHVDEPDPEDQRPDASITALGPVSQLRSALPSSSTGVTSACPSLSAVIGHLKYTDDDFQRVEETTRGQHNNATWHALRRQLITASNFHRVSKKCQTALKNPDDSCTALLKELVHGPAKDISDLPQIDWGRRKEGKAREAYCHVEGKKHTRFEVKTTGLYMCKSMPFLGCSPDGLASCRCHPGNERLLEIKCPHSQRLKHPSEAARHCGCELDQDSGQWKLKKTHQYYAQVQGQLGIVGLQSCDFVVYSTKGIHVVSVPFDSDYFDSLKCMLTTFVDKYYIPYVLQ